MSKKLNPFPEKDWENWVGYIVEKKSGKPFKSGLKHGVVISKTINPRSNKSGFLMNDDSIVDCHQVIKSYEFSTECFLDPTEEFINISFYRGDKFLMKCLYNLDRIYQTFLYKDIKEKKHEIELFMNNFNTYNKMFNSSITIDELCLNFNNYNNDDYNCIGKYVCNYIKLMSKHV